MLPRSLRQKLIVGIVVAITVAIAMLIAIPRQFTSNSSLTAQAATATQCQTVCWRPVEAYVESFDGDSNDMNLIFFSRPILVGEFNMNLPTANQTVWKRALNGLAGSSAEMRELNRHMVASEINMYNNPTGGLISVLNTLGCQGRTFTPVTVNGQTITDAWTFDQLLVHTRNTIIRAKTPANLTALASVYRSINGSFDAGDPYRCN